MGPALTPPRERPPTPALDPSRRRLLDVIGETPATTGATVGDLVAALGGHPNTTRHHVRALVRAGLVRAEQAPSTGGRGRPSLRYALTPAGVVARDAGSTEGGVSPEYVALAAVFAERLADRGGDPGADARAIGNAWGTSLADRPDQDVGRALPAHEQVIGLLGRLGFSPVAETGSGAGSGTTVLLQTCPLLEAARRHPEVVCQVHFGLVAGALEANGELSDGLSLVPFARPGSCLLSLPPTLVP